MSAIAGLMGAADRLQQRWPAIAFPVAVWSKFNDDQAGNLAALISYYAYAALLPMLLVLVTVLNIVLRNDPSLRAQLLQSAVSQYPVMAEIKANLGSVPGTGAALVIGIVLLLLGARGVAGAMQNALCVVWDIPRDQRPGFPWSYLWAFALLFAIGGGFVITTFLSSVAGGVGQVINGAVAHIATVLISLLVNIGVFWLSFRIATARMIPWRNLLTGAAIAAACWTILQLVGGYVIGHQLQRSSELYGTFGIVLGLLAWLFLQAEVTLYAAEVDVVVARGLWPTSILPGKDEAAEKDEAADKGDPAGQDSPPGKDEAAGEDQTAGESRGKHARPDERSSLEERPGPDGQPSASDKKAGSAR